ncbi:MAG: OmpA family protein [Alphaproteobacteria bacterium]
MTKRVLAMAAVGFGALNSVAMAAPQGPFIGIMGGANFSQDHDLSGGGLTINRSVDTDTGWAVLPSIGYRYENGLRTELELGYRKNDVDSISGATNGSGEIKAKSVMLNLVYDVETRGRLSPYIGGGVGIANVRYDNVNPVGVGGITDKDDVFAYQGMAGVTYALTDAMEVAAEYRYFATRDPDLRTSAGVALKGDYDSHAALVGVRWNFGTPKQREMPKPVAQVSEPEPAPAPVAEPPALPRNFLVFFDFDRSNLSGEAEAILADAASYARAHGAVRIAATGHADRSGSDEYNRALSMRRATAVKAKLLSLGVMENEIAIDAKGESDPLVPTDDGMREPQNRRVEIVLG